MSTDYDMKCMMCGSKLETVASASIAYGEKMWRDVDALDRLQAFLFLHMGHPLVFDNSQRLEDDEDDLPAGETKEG